MIKSTNIAFIISLLFHSSIFCLAGFDHRSCPTKKVEISLVMDQSKQEAPVAKKDPVKKKKVVKKKKTSPVKRTTLKDIPKPILDPRPNYCLRDSLLLPKKRCIALNNSKPLLPQFQKEEIHNEDFASGRSSLIQWYLGLIWQKVEEAKVYPEKARKNNQQGVVKVQFLVREDGQVREVEIIESPGKILLDQASLDTIEKAAPFPPIPPFLDMKEINVKIPIVFKLERRL